MEQSWTEPPPVGWVLIGGRKRAAGRRRSAAVGAHEPKRC